MKGYDAQYNCLVRFNVVTDLNSAKLVAERNRELMYVRDMMLGRAERNKGLADDNMYELNMAFIAEYEHENMIEIEEDAKDYLSKIYLDRRHAKLRKRLNFIRNKEFEFSHLKDLALVLMPSTYYEKDFYNRYAEIGSAIRDNYLNMTSLIKYLDVSDSSFRMILKLDYAMKAYLSENMRMNVREVETTLFSKAIVDRDFKAISYVLSNLFRERYRGEYSADLNITKSEVDKVLDDMSAEDLVALFNSMRVDDSE